ncbi:ABC transporter substrate-binding protein [Leadbettera azotonutricia]|uniref:Putative bacterial extracellular solute-binding protein n=1 Tax=Leadbettera azotonutricia (strain ATCC BAA-888 / DSM 13862 / ZAS-9) TaxID=545695 RepID=F5Y9F2_LEAAZ|nr:extracellular solute-binding protein [Leadbettera azotonutricia]AEF81901.1 putative bacterial extracellular solute-binding protein [Leadbettera azotonutricia ZAS-9]
MKKLSSIWFFSAFLAVFLVLPGFLHAGGAKASDGGVKTISFANWASVEEATQSRIAAVITAFEQAHPDLKIDVQGIPVSDIVKEITIRSTAGNPPDIAQLSSDNVRQLQSANLLIPLDDLLSADFKKDLYPDLYDATGLIDGKHYAAPWANSTHGLFYNKKLLAQAGLDPNKPPKTIDELNAILRAAKPKLPAGTLFLQVDTTVRTLGLIHQWPFLLAFNNGVEPYNLKGEVHFNTPGIKAYLEWLRWLVKEEYTLPGLKYGEFRPYAAQDKLLFGNDWTTFDGILRSLNPQLTPAILYETWGATALPAGSDGKARTPVQAHALVIFRNSKVQKETASFLEFLAASPDSLNKYIAASGFTPATQSAFSKAPAFSESGFIKSFISDVVPTSVPMPTGPDYASYAEIIMTAVQQVITTDAAIQPILDDGQKKLEALFK